MLSLANLNEPFFFVVLLTTKRGNPCCSGIASFRFNSSSSLASAGRTNLIQEKICLYQNHLTPALAGKLLPYITHLTRYWIIPALAGKTPNHHLLYWYRQDHPRTAGKICTCKPTDSYCQDHPRIRGENELLKTVPSLRVESPPHTRGKHFANPLIAFDPRQKYTPKILALQATFEI